jgi:hypothetical protein
MHMHAHKATPAILYIRACITLFYPVVVLFGERSLKYRV